MNTDEIKRAFVRLYNRSSATDRSRTRVASPVNTPAPARTSDAPVSRPESAQPAEVETDRGTMERVHTQSSISQAQDHRLTESAPGVRGYETQDSRSAAPSWLDPFEPIALRDETKRSVEPARSIDRLQLPFVVRQVLDQATTTWERFAEAIYGRCKQGGLKTLLITGNERMEGYTTVSIALAVALAMKDDLRVALLDADFSAPSVARQLRLEVEMGLEAVILEDVAVEDVFVYSKEPPLTVVPLNQSFRYPGLIVNRDRVRQVMEKIRDRFDVALLDGGAVFGKTGPAPLTLGVDGALLVRQPEITSTSQLENVRDYLHAKGIVSLGAIENSIAMVRQTG